MAKPLRFDAFIAKDFSFRFDIIDTTHVSMTFSAQPDRGVTLDVLTRAFEDALTAASSKPIPEETFARIRDRQLAGLDTDGRPDKTTRDFALTLLSLGAAPIPFREMRQTLASSHATNSTACCRRWFTMGAWSPN